jgi:hypothetical protein
MMIPTEVSLAMFKHADVNRRALFLAFSLMAPHYLRGEFRKTWSAANPSRNFDYVVSEWLICYVAPPGSFAFRMAVPGQVGKHYFVRWTDRTIVDLTAEQFDQWELVDYAAAKKASFAPPSPSFRAKVLDNLMKMKFAKDSA